MENDDRRRALLKELLMQYVDYDIVELSSEEFDNFIDFVDPGDDLLQALTQYEFILWTRERFIAWQLQPAH
jgi:succinate dehydrogenase flavin-adding protein (antitoxin of CptAB toxin-antitoxin module)